jgi:hypothetical protein
MSDFEVGLLDAQDYYLRGVRAGNDSYSKVAGQELRKGNPATINKFRENLAKIEKLSNEVLEKRAAVLKDQSASEAQAKNGN